MKKHLHTPISMTHPRSRLHQSGRRKMMIWTIGKWTTRVFLVMFALFFVGLLFTYKQGEQKVKQQLESTVSNIHLLPEKAKGITKKTIKEEKYAITTSSSSRINNQIKLTAGSTSVGITSLASPSLGEVNAVSAEQEENKTIYTNIYNGVNLIYTRSENRLLEEFEVRSPRTITEVIQKIDLTNATYKTQKDGSILVFNKSTGEFSFAIPRPVMYEKNDLRARSYGLHYEIVEYQGHTFLLKVIDETGSEWMKKASYPIMIDATIDLTLSSYASYPVIDNSWTVRIDTVGEGDLTIAPSADLTVSSFACGEKQVPYSMNDGKLVSKNFSCADQSLITFSLTSDTKQSVTFTYSGLSTTVETPEYAGKPVILSSTLSPAVVQVGDTITVSAEILDQEGIEKVTADMGGVETIILSRKSGTDTHGEWEGKWKVHNTSTKPYQTVLKATNKVGNSTISQIAFFDPYTCNGGGDHAGADWTPATDCPSGFAGEHTNIGTFSVATSTTASVTAYDGSQYGSASISASTVSIVGTLSADGKGYRGGAAGANGEGPGKGLGSSSGGTPGGAGAHGGSGGSGGVSGGFRYGSLTAPTDMGSGGGGGNVNAGSNGGGAFYLAATGTVTVSGTITAGGNASNVGSCAAPGGAGAGGSVYIRAGTITGNGTIRANGGNGANNCGTSGNGAGGRIALYYSSSNSFGGTVAVSVGSGGNGGEYGTSFIEDSVNHDLIIPGTNSQWNGGERFWTFRDITINGSVTFQASSSSLLTITSTGTTSFGNSSQTVTLGGTYSNNTDGQGVYLNLTGSVTIPSTTTISANGKGYAGGAVSSNGGGSGAGTGSTYGGGGTHGGVGGVGSSSTVASLYDSLESPADLGSGGGGSSSYAGANGGGAIKVTTTGTLTVSGTITANGDNGNEAGCGTPAGGGAGGAIYISAPTLAGAGTIRANGGTGANDCGTAGNGGGGRVAAYFTTGNTFSGTFTALAGTGSGNAGVNGSAFMKDTTNNDLTIPSNNGIWYASDLASWTFRNITINGSISFYPQSATLLTITSTGTTSFGASALTVTLGGTYNSNSNGKGVYLNLTGNVTIPSTTTISANGTGYAGGAAGTAGSGPGGGTGGSNPGGGGGYGDSGGAGSTGFAGGSAYGSLTNPTDLGSGGGGGTVSVGSAGGGAIKLFTTGTLTVSGTITANGTAGANYGCTPNPGGGSGGSIWISAPTLAGAGTIRANGGAGVNNCGQSGNGGGGRVAVYYTTGSTFSGAVTAIVGSGGNGGSNGTSFIEDTMNHNLTITANNGRWYTNERTSWSFNDLTINGNIYFQPVNATQFVVSSIGTTTIASGVTITSGTSYTTNTNGTGVYFRFAGNVTLPATSTITSDSLGYAGGAISTAGSGPGGGAGSPSGNRSAGGGYGGAGGNSDTGQVGGSTYGSSTVPVDLGSGGGGSPSVVGGVGGGAIRIAVDGTFTMSGTLTANGATSGNNGCVANSGGGSGGSILVTADTLAGAGTVRANGGNGVANCGTSGNGGGGRVALHYVTANNYSGTPTVTAGSGGNGGSAGTSVATQVSLPNATASLAQYTSDCSTSVATGGSVEGGGSGATVCFKGVLSDTDNPDSLSLEVETKAVGTNFTGVGASMSAQFSYSGSGVTASLLFGGHSLGVNFHWRARTVDQYGMVSSWTSFGGNAESASDFLATIPPPTNITVTYNSDTSMTITWTDNAAGEDGYIVERSTNGGSFANVSGTLAANTTTFTDNSSNNPSDPPAANEKYDYRVYATISGANSSSDLADTIYTTPSAPSGSSASQTAVGSITITWTDNATYETYFEIQRQKDGGSFSSITATVAADTSTYTDTTVHEAGAYVYKVRAIRNTPDSLQSAYSTASSVTLSSSGYGKGVFLSADGRLFLQNDFENSVDVWTKVDSDVSDQTGSDVTYSSSLPAQGPHLPTGATLNNLTVKEGASEADGKSDVVYVGTDLGLVAIHENHPLPARGAIKRYTKDYISELLQGDARGMWPLDSAYGSGLSDVTNHAETLTNQGTVTFATSGIRGYAGSFNGSTQYLTISDDANLSVTGNLTVGAWFKTTSVSTAQTILAKNGSYTIGITAGGVLEGSIIGSTTATVTGQTSLDTGWHHVVMVYEQATQTVYLYLDGQLDTSTTTSVPSSITDSSGAFQIGANGGSTLFSGLIDEPFVSSSVYNAGQARLMYTTGYKAQQNHTASRVTGITDADDYQKLSGGGSSGATVNDVRAVAIDEANQFLFVGTYDSSGNTGGVSTIAISSDSLVDLYDSTNNTSKKDDNDTQFSGNDIVAISIAGNPNPSYTPDGNNPGSGGMVVIAGTNDTATRVWLERQNYSLGDVLGTAAQGGSTGQTATITDLLRVGSLFTNRSSSSGEVLLTPALEVNQQGRLTANYLGIDDGSTAFSFTDANDTTGSVFGITASAITSGNALAITANALTTGNGVTVTSSTASFSGALINIAHTGVVNGIGYGEKITMSGTGTTNVGLSVSASGATNNYAALFTAGNVGVGTTSPSLLFHVVGSASATSSALLENSSTGSSASVLSLKLGSTSPASTNSFATFLNGNGEVIGKITGNGSSGVTYATTGSDIAEYFEKAKDDEVINASDVVCLSGLGGVTKCSSLEKNVLGIVSDRAGFVGGANHSGDRRYVLVGLVGQLPVRISSSSADIMPGDMLTVSSEDGALSKRTDSKSPVVARSLQVYSPKSSPLPTVLALVTLSSVTQDTLNIPDAYLSSSAFSDIKGPVELSETTVDSTLTVLGRTTLSDVGITGKVISGLLSIDGARGSINVTGDLHIQPDRVGKVDIFAGNVVIEPNGNITTKGVLSARKIRIDESDPEEASIGTAVIRIGSGSAVIKTNALTNDSRIFATPDSPVLFGVKKNSKTSFMIIIDKKQEKDIRFDWWIVN